MIENEIGFLDGFRSIDFRFFYDKDGSYRNAIMAESNYNQIMGFLDRDTITIGKGNIYLVSGSLRKSVKEIPNEYEEIFIKHNLSLNIIGNSDLTIMMTGFVNNICVLSDDDFKILEPNLSEKQLFAFDYDHWEIDSDTPQRVKTALGFTNETKDFYLTFAYDYYNTSKLINSLALYIGAILCFTFILAVASFVYSRLYSSLDSESKKYKNIAKIGLSKKELSQLLSKEVSLILLVPFIVAIIYMWVGICLIERFAYVSNIPTTFVCTVILVIIQTISWLGVKTAYKNSMFNKVFDEI